MSGMQWAVITAFVAFLAFPGRGVERAGTAADAGIRAPDAQAGTLRLLSYNVAGLPQWISKRRPSEQVPQIAQRLGGYDLVLLQEDFAHHNSLFGSARSYPYRSGDLGLGVPFLGDGLSRLSRLAFEQVAREPWKVCNGVVGNQFDCWAVKGLSYARHQLSAETTVDVYNVHLDAGSGNGDRKAKRAQVDQLARAIERRSRGRAVIVAGDSNLKSAPHLARRLIRKTGLRDACEAMGCDERLSDRVLYRSGDDVMLEALDWRREREAFLDEGGEPLSDHDPITVGLRWSTSAAIRRAELSPRRLRAPAPLLP